MHRGPRELRLSQHRVTIRPAFPDTSSFLAFVRASGRVFENRRFVRVFGPIRKYIRTLPIAKAYDGMRQIKLVSFQYKMSVTSQNATLVQASCTCLALSSVYSVSIQKHVSPVV